MKLIEQHIIGAMLNKKIWEKRHTNAKNLTKGLPKHLKGKAKKVIANLIKQQILKTKINVGQLHVSLNIKRIKEIYEIVENRK